MREPLRLRAFLTPPLGAVCLRIYRFSRQGAVGAGPDLVADLVGDDLSGDHSRPGLRLLWLDAAGHILDQISAWPARPSLESEVLPACFRAVAQARAWIEVQEEGTGLFAVGQLVERWYGANPLADLARVFGDRDPRLPVVPDDPTRALVAAGWQVESSGAAVRLSRITHRPARRAHLLFLPLIALSVPVLVPFRKGREIVSSMFRGVFRAALTSGDCRLEYEVTPGMLRIVESDEEGRADPVEVPTSAIVAVSDTPLRVITQDAVVRLPASADRDPTLGAALKAVLAAAVAAGTERTSTAS